MSQEDQARRFLALMRFRKWCKGAILISGELDLSGRRCGAPRYQTAMERTNEIIDRIMR